MLGGVFLRWLVQFFLVIQQQFIKLIQFVELFKFFWQ